MIQKNHLYPLVNPWRSHRLEASVGNSSWLVSHRQPHSRSYACRQNFVVPLFCDCTLVQYRGYECWLKPSRFLIITTRFDVVFLVIFFLIFFAANDFLFSLSQTLPYSTTFCFPKWMIYIKMQKSFHYSCILPWMCWLIPLVRTCHERSELPPDQSHTTCHHSRTFATLPYPHHHQIFSSSKKNMATSAPGRLHHIHNVKITNIMLLFKVSPWCLSYLCEGTVMDYLRWSWRRVTLLYLKIKIMMMESNHYSVDVSLCYLMTRRTCRLCWFFFFVAFHCFVLFCFVLFLYCEEEDEDDDEEERIYEKGSLRC